MGCGFDEAVLSLVFVIQFLSQGRHLAPFEVSDPDRPPLKAALCYSDGSRGGRRPYDAVAMFKVLILAAQKDTNARWMVEIGRPRDENMERNMPELAIPMFGYKSHIAIARRFGFLHTRRMALRLAPFPTMATANQAAALPAHLLITNRHQRSCPSTATWTPSKYPLHDR